MELALTSRKKSVFGLYLHTLQDAYSHWREGYTSDHASDSQLSRERNLNINHLKDDFFDGGHWEGIPGISRKFIPSPYLAHPREEVIRDVQTRNPWLNASTLSDNDLIDLYLRYDETDPYKYIRKLERSYFGFETDKYIEYSTRDTLMQVESKMFIDRFLFDYMFNLCFSVTQNNTEP
jgi:hypothetical protein